MPKVINNLPEQVLKANDQILMLIVKFGFSFIRRVLKNRWKRKPTVEQILDHFQIWYASEGPNSFRELIAGKMLVSLRNYEATLKKTSKDWTEDDRLQAFRFIGEDFNALIDICDRGPGRPRHKKFKGLINNQMVLGICELQKREEKEEIKKLEKIFQDYSKGAKLAAHMDKDGGNFKSAGMALKYYINDLAIIWQHRLPTGTIHGFLEDYKINPQQYSALKQRLYRSRKRK